jgi:tripartite-type tricarboxylate transporter receptor subunit TctC
MTLTAGALTAGVVAPVGSQSLWPERPVRVIVPFPPGGLTDGIARLIGQQLGESLGHPFVLENVGGAAGAIAASMVARAPADGYTLLIASLTQFAILPAMEAVAYDPIKDFTPVSNIAIAPFVLMINAAIPVHTVKEFVDYVRINPGRATYASGGVGSVSHLSMALFLKRAGIEMIHVPYKGGAPAIGDLMAGNVAAYFGTRTDAIQQLHGGAIRLLAVSDDMRSVQLPAAPTLAECGYPDFRTIAWNGLAAPAGTPAAIIGKVADAVRAATGRGEFVRRLNQIGVDPVADGPQAFAATIEADIPRWAEAVRASGARLQ